METASEESVAATEAQDPLWPKVVSVTPANGSEGVATTNTLRIRFDRPMDPMSLKLNWKSGGFLDWASPSYDSNRFEFSVPVRLAPGALHRIVVNQPLLGMQLLKESRQQFAYEGFQSADRHQAALFVWQFRTEAGKAGVQGTRPKVRSISPAPGSTATLLTFVEVQFDQPMMDAAEAFPWVGSQTNVWKTVGLIANVQYNPTNYTFRLPVLLPPRDALQWRWAGRTFEVPRMFTPNGTVSFSLDGFRSATGVAAAPIRLQYKVAEVEVAGVERDRIRHGTTDPRLFKLLAGLKQQRAQLRSLAERVQVLDLARQDGLLASLESKSASFRMQLPNCFYGDISQIMECRAFRIGGNGQNWWFHFENGGKGKVIVCPANQMHIVELSFGDPFGLATEPFAKAAADLRLNYAGRVKVDGVEYHLVEAWNAEAFGSMITWGSLRQWWIEARSLRPVEVIQFGNSSVTRMRFLHDAVNEPLAPEVFAVPKGEGVPSVPPEALDTGYTQRVVIIRDGANGRMSERWGKQGPKGMASGGLN